MKKILILIIGILFLPFNIHAEELKIHVIECNVQGDSTLLETNDQYLLMDTCVKSQNSQVLNYLENQGITNFDIYLSHFHGDHYGLIMDILNNSKYTISNIYLPEYNQDESLISQITAVASEKNINVIYLKTGSEFNFDKAKISIVGPLPGTENLENKINNNSLVAKIKIDNTTFLSAGDIEKEQEALLLENNVDVKADIMKLSHHGGYTSNTEDFIAAVNPSYAFYHYYVEAEKTNFASDSWTKETIAKVNEKTNVLSTGYNGNIIYDIKDDEITITPTRNYLTATINYIDYDNDQTFKVAKIPFVKNTKFYYQTNDLLNYKFFGDDNLSGKVLNDNQEINLYYTNLNTLVEDTPSLLVNASDNSENDEEEEPSDDSIKICTEVDGLYYGLDGSITNKEDYYNDCGTVDNPTTGKIVSWQTLAWLLIIGFGFYILFKKHSKLQQI